MSIERHVVQHLAPAHGEPETIPRSAIRQDLRRIRRYARTVGARRFNPGLSRPNLHAQRDSVTDANDHANLNLDFDPESHTECNCHADLNPVRHFNAHTDAYTYRDALLDGDGFSHSLSDGNDHAFVYIHQNPHADCVLHAHTYQNVYPDRDFDFNTDIDALPHTDVDSSPNQHSD